MTDADFQVAWIEQAGEPYSPQNVRWLIQRVRDLVALQNQATKLIDDYARLLELRRLDADRLDWLEQNFGNIPEAPCNRYAIDQEMLAAKEDAALTTEKSGSRVLFTPEEQ